MNDSNSPKNITDNNKNLAQIIKNLKDQPFLLIFIAFFILLLGLLAFDVEKIREIKYLLIGFAVLCLLMQFYLELRKSNIERHKNEEATQQQLNLSHSPDALDSQSKVLKLPPYSLKAILSMVLILISLSEFDSATNDYETLLGLFVLSFSALCLAVFSWYDIHLGRARGKNLAITSILLSSLLTDVTRP